jgi:hypothetical protein
VPALVPTGKVVRPGELQRRLDGLAAPADRVDAGRVHRHDVDQLGRVGLEHLGRELRPVDVVDPPGLLRQHSDHVRITVPETDDDRSAGRIEIPLPVRVLDPGPLRPNRDGRGGR